jgi:hypothetical protein
MKTYERTKTPHKPGPKPMAAEMTRGSFALPKALWEWAADQPEGASALLRRLLQDEQARQQQRNGSPFS